MVIEYNKDQIAKAKEMESKRKTLISELNPKNHNKSTYLDYLKYLSLKNKKVDIAILGSSVTKGVGASDYSKSWAGLLNSELSNMTEINNINTGDISIQNHGFTGYKAQDLLDKGKVDDVIKEKPDFVIFETSVINNYEQSTLMDDTLNDMGILLNKLKSELPNTKVLVISPNPISETGKNSAGYSYDNYLTKTKEMITNKGFNYLDINKKMVELLEKKKIKIDELLVDGVHPNDMAYNMWFKILMDYLKNSKQAI